MTAADERALLTNLTLARGSVDRAAHLRADAAAWNALLAASTTRAIVVHGSRTLAFGDPFALVRVSLADLEPGYTPVLLGLDDEGPIVGALYPRDAELDDLSGTWGDLREFGAKLDATDAGLLTAAIALAHWRASHLHCPTCGRPTTLGGAGWVAACEEHGEQHPRTDPAVIVLVRDADDRALLGRRGEWPDGWYSTLAGFVEAGESAEVAVAREVAEESGVAVDPASLVYLGSQPWPFPRSLMLGYHARAIDPSATKPDGVEITEVRWFTRDELASGCAAGEIRIPPSVSVARRLIERWYGAELPGEWARS